MAYTISHNTPSVGYVSWANMNIQYKGVSYAIANGNTNRKYVWWDLSYPTAFKVTNTFPNLTNDDVLVIYNKNGTAVLIPNASVIPGDLIVPGSIAADHLSANCVTGEKILAGAISSSEIAANSIGASHIVSNSILSNHIKSGAILADHIAANQITADHLVSEGIDANAITVGTLTGIKLISRVGTSKIEIEGDEFRSYTNNKIGVMINDGQIKLRDWQSNKDRMDVHGISNGTRLVSLGKDGSHMVKFTYRTASGYVDKVTMNYSNNTIFSHMDIDVTGEVDADIVAAKHLHLWAAGRTSYVTGTSNAFVYSSSHNFQGETNMHGSLVLQSRSSAARPIDFITGNPPTRKMRLAGNGYLGIGKNPSFHLDVAGTVKIDRGARISTRNGDNPLYITRWGNTYEGLKIFNHDSVTYIDCVDDDTPPEIVFRSYDKDGGPVYKPFKITCVSAQVTGNFTVSGSLGIGKNPHSAYKLDVKGAAWFDGLVTMHGLDLRRHGSSPYLDFTKDSSSADYGVRFILVDNNHLGLWGGHLIPQGDGTANVGIPGKRFHTMCARHFYTSSNRDIKDDIQDADIKNCYDIVKALKLRTYKLKNELKEDSAKTETKTKVRYHTGVVTEEAPDAITDDEKMNINLYGYTSQVLGAVQEIQNRLEQLERRTSNDNNKTGSTA